MIAVLSVSIPKDIPFASLKSTVCREPAVTDPAARIFTPSPNDVSPAVSRDTLIPRESTERPTFVADVIVPAYPLASRDIPLLSAVHVTFDSAVCVPIASCRSVRKILLREECI